MNNSKKVITLKNIFSILVNNKKWFLIVFLIILIGGISLTLIKQPSYTVEASLKLINNREYYDKFLLETFPGRSKDLWLYEKSEIEANENKIIDEIENEIHSSNFMEELKSQVSFNLELEELEGSIYSYRKQNSNLYIKVVNNDRQKAYEILKKTVNLLKENKREELSVAYNQLIKEMDVKIEGLAEEESDSMYNNLINARGNLVENKDIFINRIELENDLNIADVYSYTNRIRDIIISFSIAVFVGLIVSFSRYYFNLLKTG